jgi:hypothetical protein
LLIASRCSPKVISAMPINFRISALVPVGLIVEGVAQLDDSILATARAGSRCSESLLDLIEVPSSHGMTSQIHHVISSNQSILAIASTCVYRKFDSA